MAAWQMGLQAIGAVGSLFNTAGAAQEADRLWQMSQRENRRLRRDIIGRHAEAREDIIPTYEQQAAAIQDQYRNLAMGQDVMGTNMMAMLQGYGDQTRADVRQRSFEQEAAANAALQQRGLAGTTRAGVTGLQAEEMEQAQLARLQDQLSRMNVQTYLQGREGVLNAQRAGLSAAERMSAGRAGLLQNLAAGKVGSLERMQFPYPNQTPGQIRADHWGAFAQILGGQ